MNFEICELKEDYNPAWDSYVNNHKFATIYHLSGWKNVIEKTYGHKTFYLYAYQQNALNGETPGRNKQIIGVLPLVYMKHFIFGRKLISIPFFDTGGILADDEKVEKNLIEKAIDIADNLKTDAIELRQTFPLSWIKTKNDVSQLSGKNTSVQLHKTRMILELADSSEELMKSFKSKLRSQIKKPIKEGLTTQIGGPELLDGFYNVFAENMRDLGSPVHSKQIVRNTLIEFSETARIVLVQKGEVTVACALIAGCNKTLANPWASSLRRFSSYSANMLLYWAMLEYACDNGYRFFDFGRSTPDEGTYRFKKQWGANPQQLYWHDISLLGEANHDTTSETLKFDRLIEYWKKLPVAFTKIIGPRLRKHIGL